MTIEGLERLLRSPFTLTILILCWTGLLAQETASVREALFEEVDAKLVEAASGNLETLSPKRFQEAKKRCAEAEKKYAEGKALKDIEEEIDRCLAELNGAFEAGKLSQVVLEEPIRLRQQLIESEIPLSQSNKFRDAEKKLREAGEKVEKDDVKGARNKGTEAAKKYREATVEGLEKTELKIAEDRLKKARGNIEKDTYKEAEQLLKQAEKMLDQRKKEDFDIAELINQIRMEINKALSTAGLV
jgi:hypothetical protein